MKTNAYRATSHFLLIKRFIADIFTFVKASEIILLFRIKVGFLLWVLKLGQNLLNQIVSYSYYEFTIGMWDVRIQFVVQF
jgi:hypothetical protein